MRLLFVLPIHDMPSLRHPNAHQRRLIFAYGNLQGSPGDGNGVIPWRGLDSEKQHSQNMSKSWQSTATATNSGMIRNELILTLRLESMRRSMKACCLLSMSKMRWCIFSTCTVVCFET